MLQLVFTTVGWGLVSTVWSSLRGGDNVSWDPDFRGAVTSGLLNTDFAVTNLFVSAGAVSVIIENICTRMNDYGLFPQLGTTALIWSYFLFLGNNFNNSGRKKRDVDDDSWTEIIPDPNFEYIGKITFAN